MSSGKIKEFHSVVNSKRQRHEPSGDVDSEEGRRVTRDRGGHSWVPAHHWIRRRTDYDVDDHQCLMNI